jgi:hypothetical protein
MGKFIKTCLSSASDDNYLSKNDASTQVLYLINRIFSDFFQNENCWPSGSALPIGLNRISWKRSKKLVESVRQTTTLAIRLNRQG